MIAANGSTNTVPFAYLYINCLKSMNYVYETELNFFILKMQAANLNGLSAKRFIFKQSSNSIA